MRTLVDIPDHAIRMLDELALRTKRSRAAVIRAAIEAHLQSATDNSWIFGPGFGYWRDRDDIGDAVEYQRAAREDRESYD